MKYYIKYRNDLLDLISDFIDKKYNNYEVYVDKSNLDCIFRTTTIEALTEVTGLTFNVVEL